MFDYVLFILFLYYILSIVYDCLHFITYIDILWVDVKNTHSHKIKPYYPRCFRNL